MASHSLEIQGITKRFGDHVVLNGISLKAQPGELISILGPSGCGKSTLLRVIAGLERAQAGSVSINGAVVDQVLPKDRGIAYVFQNYALYPHLTAAENIAAPLVMRELNAFQRFPGLGRFAPHSRERRKLIAERVRETIKLLKIEDLCDRRPSQLSGGQRQRVALGRALVREPTVFLMDEPLANLDANLRIRMRSEIAAIQQRSGVTTIFVTHDQMEALALSNRIAVMFDGVFRQVAKPTELYRNPVGLDVARFLSQPHLNEIAGRASGEAFVEVADQRVAVKDAIDTAGPGTLAFRPEDAALVPIGTAGAATVIVDRLEHAGADAHVFARILPQGSQIVVRVSSEELAKFGAGEKYGLVIDPDKSWFFPANQDRVLGRRCMAA